MSAPCFPDSKHDTFLTAHVPIIPFDTFPTFLPSSPLLEHALKASSKVVIAIL